MKFSMKIGVGLVCRQRTFEDFIVPNAVLNEWQMADPQAIQKFVSASGLVCSCCSSLFAHDIEKYLNSLLIFSWAPGRFRSK